VTFTVEDRNRVVVENLRLSRRFFKKHFAVRRWLSRAFGSGPDAEQWAALALVRAADTWDPRKGKFSHWAYLLVRSVVYHAARREEKSRVCAESLRPGMADANRRLAYAHKGFAEVDNSDWLDALPVQKLTPRQRRFLAWRAEGMTLAEIGGRAGITRERVRQIVLKAVAKLKKGLRAEGV
jgi:RNA polymerase sigma factor (sigma-70 family)